jgi:hypothetical protein
MGLPTVGEHSFVVDVYINFIVSNAVWQAADHVKVPLPLKSSVSGANV